MSLRRLFFALCAPMLLMGAINVLPPPVVVVYPISATGGLSAEDGASLGVLLATRISQAGGITVKPAPPGTQRSDYLTAARKLDADYYVSGFIAPLGDQVSLVTQVVSTYSGSIVGSETTMVRTFGEASGQGQDLAAMILRHAGRSLATLNNPTPAPSETPQPKKGPNEANIGGLFKRKPKATPAPKGSAAAQEPSAVAEASPKAPAVMARTTPAPKPSPAPKPTAARELPAPRPLPTAAQVANVENRGRRGRATPLPTKPPSAYVFPASGDAAAAVGTAATESLVAALRAGGVTAAKAPSEIDPAAKAREFCGANPSAKALYAPTLTALKTESGATLGVEMELVEYDCNGKVVTRKSAQAGSGSRNGLTGAAETAAARAVRELLATPKP